MQGTLKHHNSVDIHFSKDYKVITEKIGNFLYRCGWFTVTELLLL